METWQAIIVGIVQGFSEFLPISSSGHIAITQFLLGIRVPGNGVSEDITLEVLVHLGTFLSVSIYFRKRLWALFLALFQRDKVEERKMILYLIIATVPAAAAYFMWGDFFEGAYNNPIMVSLLLIGTGVILLLPKLFIAKLQDLKLPQALIMGFAQALAILPGVSRSGSTITLGVMAGVRPAQAAEFSFLMFLPAIGGGTLLKATKLSEAVQGANGAAYVWSFFAAFLSGLFAVYLVLALVKKGRFAWFAYYCFIAGISFFLYFKFLYTAPQQEVQVPSPVEALHSPQNAREQGKDNS